MARKRRNSVDQGSGPEQSNRDYQAALREKQVAELRLSGLQFAEIAELCGYAGKQGAHKAWKKYLANLPIEETAQRRIAQDLRLDAAVAALWPKLKKGDLWAIARLVEVEKRRAELLGLDTPPKAPAPTPTTIVFQTNFDTDAL